jgi:MFS family permease
MFVGITDLTVAMPLLAMDRFDWTQGQVGLLFTGLGALSFVIQGGLIGKILKIARDVDVAITGAVLMAIGLALIGFAPSPKILLLGLCAVGVGMGMNGPVLQTMASEAAGEKRRGAILGVLQSSGGLARTVGPVWAGFLFKRFDMSTPFLSGAATCALMALLAVTLRKTPSVS